MNQKLVIQESFFNSVIENIEIIKEKGVANADLFFQGIIKKLNDEFSFLEIDGYRFSLSEESNEYSQYGAFIEGSDLPYEKIIIFFTPISSKQGNVIIEQSLMPTICKQMNLDITFLLNAKYKKIVVLTSKINSTNEVSISYNKLQMDINSLNTMNFDVIPFFAIKNLSTDTYFNSLTEYLEMSNFLQKKAHANSQIQLMWVKDNTLYGHCEKSQLKGEFQKSFCFRFLSAIFAGGNDFKYNIDGVLNKLDRIDNQFGNLKNFVEYANTNILKPTGLITPSDDDIIEGDDDIQDIDNIHRVPDRGVDPTGRKRFKTQRKIRDSVLEKAHYMCDCDDAKHFYFESVDLHNYVEGHHVVPMNRQEEYYFDENINLDVPNNIVALCPTCHCQIHLGSRQARLKILSELFVRNKAKLLTLNPRLTLSILASYYNIGLEDEEERDWLKRAEKVVADKKNFHT